jgi:uncharacterized protein DUF4157
MQQRTRTKDASSRGSRAQAHPTPNKLTVSRPGDAHEREADQVADRMLRPGSAGQELSLPVTPLQSGSAGQELPVTPLQAESYASGETIDQAFHLPGGGERLPAELKDFFESRFGRDFGNVQVHTGSEAAASASDLHARAYTTANHIVFNENEYAPQDGEGRRLLAHELTHVAQQSEAGGVDTNTIQREAQEEDESWLTKIGKMAENANDATGGKIPGLGLAGSLASGVGEMGDGLGSGTGLGLAKGAASFGKGTVELAEHFGEDTLDGASKLGLGKVAGVLDVAMDGMDAYSDFSKGKTGAGVFDVVKGVGHGLSTYAKFTGGGGAAAGEGAAGVAEAGTVGAGVTEAGAVGAGVAEAGAVGAGVTEAGAVGAGLAEAGAVGAGVAEAGAVGAGVAGVGAGAAAAGTIGAVIAAGAAGWEMGKGLDWASNKAGQAITGNKDKDYSISGGLASTMTAADNALTPLWADPSKPAYTQSLGWKLGDWLGM